MHIFNRQKKSTFFLFLFFFTASIAETLHDAKQYWFDLSSIPKFNWNHLKQKRDAYIKRLNGIYANNLINDKVDFIKGRASFISKNVLKVEHVDGNVEEIEAKKILIATGTTFIYLMT